ncbi:interleukin-17 receptor D [Pseudoliparis swirei]|uniref:interleukin-17 receptor D n=1 Tax=Pseudoliparis swirei TaxID=2059687 RepID=UPI0024BE2BE1|nr:interleukin-17 receptor D [Pseudoliparis swirei]
MSVTRPEAGSATVNRRRHTGNMCRRSTAHRPEAPLPSSLLPVTHSGAAARTRTHTPTPETSPVLYLVHSVCVCVCVWGGGLGLGSPSGTMWKTALVLYQLFTLGPPLRAQDSAGIAPQDCGLDCVRQGGPGCEYCRITRADVRAALGLNSIAGFGSCIPWPCFELLGKEDRGLCQHYVHAPKDVTVEFGNELEPKSDTVVVSWKPSHYGIAFLRGFQVYLQALGGSGVACQLFLFHRNLSLPASHAQRVYKSDPFPGLHLGSEYAVTVMALPVPEEWESFYSSKIFSTRSCAEKNGLERCKKDWYPEHIEVQQEGSAINVTFNLAPPNLGIRAYFSLCYANGRKTYTGITPSSSKNKTHHSYQMNDLEEGTNYTCEIAADEVDAVRKKFNVQVLQIKKGGSPTPSATPSLALILPLCLTGVAIFVVLLAALTRRRPELRVKKLDIKPDVIKRHQESGTQEEVMSLPRKRLAPPRLLICYSSCDGPAHVRAVMQLGGFIQQHMATQVSMDLWDSLGVAEEGGVAWHCRQIRESDFVLVVCSRGLGRRPTPPTGDGEDERADAGLRSGSDAAVRLVGAEVGRAKAWGRDLSKYMAAIFDYSDEADIPAELRLVSLYALTRDLQLLFSHLHALALHGPGHYLKVDHISEEGYTELPAGAALQWAIAQARVAVTAKRRGVI